MPIRIPSAALSGLAIAAVAVAAWAPMPAMAGERSVHITQVGDANRAEIEQRSTGAEARIVQDGSGNRASISQRGGGAHQGEIRQSGSDNTASLAQTGAGAHTAELRQSGDSNVIEAAQTGRGQGVLGLVQSGENLRAEISQTTTSGTNVIGATQRGTGSLLRVTQEGGNNEAQLTQSGENNIMDVWQTGFGNKLEWEQRGNGLQDVMIAQSGNQALQVTQSMEGAQFAPPPGRWGLPKGFASRGNRTAALGCAALLLASLLLSSAASGQQAGEPDSRIGANQIGEASPRKGGKAFIAAEPAASAPQRDTLVGNPAEQVSTGPGTAPEVQLTSRTQSAQGMAQLSRAELDATLAQLTPGERRVLLQAIEGTDICDNPPPVPAILTLCQTRLETRSQEFTLVAAAAPSAEEQLLRGEIETTLLPSLSQVIQRLASANAATDDPSNQAIASVALAARGDRRDDPAAGLPDTGLEGLSPETQALVNALVNQLGGRAP